MSCNTKIDSACPFSFTEMNESVQNLGCLPTPFEIRDMRVVHGKTWACHENPTKPCTGAIQWLKQEGLLYEVIDTQLLTENSDRHLFTDNKAVL